MNGTILSAKSLYKEYTGKFGALQVLKGVNLEIGRGEMTTILGRSGSGKSTLLHLLGGLDRPDEGAIEFEGKNIVKFSDGKLSEYRLRHVSFVFQFYHLLPELTLFENVVLPGRIAGAHDEEQAEGLIARVGLLDRMDHYPSQLSGGEQQRAAIARALINKPDLVLCDEPTGNLDEKAAASVFELLLSLNEKEKTTFVIVTHDTGLAQKGTSVYELKEGVLAK